MSEEKHTPGPWMLGRSPFEVVNVDHGILRNEVVSGNILIAALYDDDIGPNARLIAAAPDMLQALKSASAFLTDLLKQGDDMAADAALYHIDQAIDKAEGRS